MGLWDSLKKTTGLPAGRAGAKASDTPVHGSTGRNDPCPCGSGKKYKKCCLEKDQKEESKRLKDLQFKPKEGSPAPKAPTAPQHPKDRPWLGFKRFFKPPGGSSTPPPRRTPGEK